MSQEFLSSVGRIVWGHPAKSQNKTDDNNQIVMKDGQPVQQWVFGLAIPKPDFERHDYQYLYKEALTAFPSGQFPPKFSWKFKDGDNETDSKGKPYREYEGRAGCYILTVSTEAFAPQIFKNEGGRYRQLEPHEIKCGDYVVVKVNCKFNGMTSPKTPGLYINPVGIELVGYGAEISSFSADPNEMFGGKTYQLPPGASATPMAPTSNAAAPYDTQQQTPQPGGMPAPAGMPGQPAQAPAMPQPAAMGNGAPVPQGMPQSMPQAGMQGNGQQNWNNGQAAPNPASPSSMPPPAHDFVQQAGMPGQPAPAQPQQPQAPAMPQQYQAPAMPGQPQPAAPGQPAGMPGLPVGR